MEGVSSGQREGSRRVAEGQVVWGSEKNKGRPAATAQLLAGRTRAEAADAATWDLN